MSAARKSTRRNRIQVKTWGRFTQRECRALRALARREERTLSAQIGLIIRRYLRGELVDARQ